jgi:hypothetical protein
MAGFVSGGIGGAQGEAGQYAAVPLVEGSSEHENVLAHFGETGSVLPAPTAGRFGGYAVPPPAHHAKKPAVTRESVISIVRIEHARLWEAYVEESVYYSV